MKKLAALFGVSLSVTCGSPPPPSAPEGTTLEATAQPVEVASEDADAGATATGASDPAYAQLDESCDVKRCAPGLQCVGESLDPRAGNASFRGHCKAVQYPKETP